MRQMILAVLLMAFASPAFAQEPMDHSAHTAAPSHQTEAQPTPLLSQQMVDESKIEVSDLPEDHGSHDMTPVSPLGLPLAAPDRMGGTEDKGVVAQDGVREFKLTAAPIAWPITGDVAVAAYAYNGQVPGPLLRVTAGENIRVILTNNLKEPTTIHWHGVDVPFEMDGVPGASQAPIQPGQSFTYSFTVPETPGTFWYHSHVAADRQQALGLYGAFVIMPKTQETPAWSAEHTILLSEWTVKEGGNVPSMPMEGMFPNYFTLNGKAWPATEKFTAKVGEPILFRLVGAGAFSHPVHLHGAPFKIIAMDGHPLSLAQQVVKDTVMVNPGERYDILWTPTRPGTWLLHCHIAHHTMNDGAEVEGMGGMAIAIDVAQ